MVPQETMRPTLVLRRIGFLHVLRMERLEQLLALFPDESVGEGALDEAAKELLELVSLLPGEDLLAATALLFDEV